MNRQQRRHPDRHATQFARPGDRVVIGVVSGGHPALGFMQSFNAMTESYLRGPLACRLDERGWRIFARSGANVSRARNRVVLEFLTLAHEPEWLLLIDDDMTWEPTALEQMLTNADPDQIHGGLCFAYGRDDRIIPTIFHADDAGRFEIVGPGYELPAQPTLLQVYGTGGAFLLIHRSALLRIGALMPHTGNAWFREVEPMVPNPDHDPSVDDSPTEIPYWISEDLFLCHQAHQAGLTVWVNTAVEVGHQKPHVLNRRLYEQARAGVVTLA